MVVSKLAATQSTDFAADRCNGLFGTHATTMIQFTWQYDSRVVEQTIKECMDVHGDLGPQSQVSDHHQPYMAGNIV